MSRHLKVFAMAASLFAITVASCSPDTPTSAVGTGSRSAEVLESGGPSVEHVEDRAYEALSLWKPTTGGAAELLGCQQVDEGGTGMDAGAGTATWACEFDGLFYGAPGPKFERATVWLSSDDSVAPRLTHETHE